MHGHVAIKFSRANADERNAIAMLRVHVRLNLKNETAERGIFGCNLNAAHHAGFRRGRMFQKTVEQQLHAEIIHAAAEKYRRCLAREHVGFVECFTGQFEHFQFFEGFAEFRFAQIAAHFRIMQSADDDGRAMFAAHDALKRVHRLGLPVVDALKFRAVADGPVHGKCADAQHAFQFVDQLQRIFHRAIALVHEGEDRHATLTADFKKFSRLRLDAFCGINHHDHCIHGSQHAIGVLGKVLVTGRVEQVETVTVVIKLQHGRADRNAALFFQLHPIAGRGALIFSCGHGTGELHGTTVEQQLLRQRGFTRVGMRNDGECAPPLDFLRNVHKRVVEHSRRLRGNKRGNWEAGSLISAVFSSHLPNQPRNAAARDEIFVLVGRGGTTTSRLFRACV